MNRSFVKGQSSEGRSKKHRLCKLLVEPLESRRLLAVDASGLSSDLELLYQASASELLQQSPSSLVSAAPGALLDNAAATLGVWDAAGPFSADNGQVENLQPYDQVAGAIHAVVAHPTNADILYIGATNGGVWRTDNATDSLPHWIPLTDQMPSQSIGALALDVADPTHNTIYAGVGRYSSLGRIGNDRVGIYKSTDRGDSWTLLDGNGMLQGANVSGLAVNGQNVVVSVNVADRFTLSNVGIFRSTDGGATFTHVSSGDGSATGLPGGLSYDVVADPINPDILYTSIVYDDGSSGRNGLYKSTNGGANWSKISNAAIDALILSGATSNLELAVGRSNNVYAGIIQYGDMKGLFRSGNGGASWTQMDSPKTNENGTDVGLNPRGVKGPGPADNPTPEEIAGGQGAIHFSIVADPNDANIVYVGGDRQPTSLGDKGSFPNSIGARDYSGRLFRGDATKATGTQFVHLTHSNTQGAIGGGTASSSSPHADSRDMVFDANGDIIEVDDGGVYRRTNPQSNMGDWFGVMGDLQITEAHDVAYDSVSNTIITGNQDNGTTYQRREGDDRWLVFTGGDGGDVAVDSVSMAAQNQSIRYSSFQRLGLFLRSIWTASGNFVAANAPPLTVSGTTQTLYDLESPPFKTPFVLNAVDPNRLLIQGSKSVYETLDQGDTITAIGDFPLIGSYGSPITFGGYRGGVANPEVAWVGSGSDVYVRTTGTGNLAAVTTAPGTGNIRDLAIDPDDWGRAIVVDGNSVHMTSDVGNSWSDITGNLLSYANRIDTVQYVSTALIDAVLVGTNYGVFASLVSNLGNWFELGFDMPNVLIADLVYNATDDVLVTGTLGRGSWMLHDVSDVLDATGTIALAIDPTSISENGGTATATVFRYGSTTGDLAINLSSSDTSEASVPNTVTIPDGQGYAHFTVTGVPDLIYDGTQQATISAFKSGYNTSAVTINVTDVTPEPQVTLQIDQTSINENGGVAILTATTNTLSTNTITVDLSFSGLATRGVDYSVGGTQIVIPPLTYSSSLAIVATNDALVEADESVVSYITSVSGASEQGAQQRMLTIIDDDFRTPIITTTATNPTNLSSIPLMIDFGGPVTGFILSDLQLVGATPSNFVSLGNGRYSLNITPTADGTILATIAGGAALDEGNKPTRASNVLSLRSDRTSPTPLVVGPADPSNSDPFNVTINFGESVLGFAQTDVSVTNGAVVAWTDNLDGTFTATIDVVADGLVTVEIDADVAFDLAGNPSLASVPFSLTVDTIAPIPVIDGPVGPTKSDPFDVVIDFGEAMMGFDASDLTITNGTAGSLTLISAGRYGISIDAITDGFVTIDLGAGVATDLAGNPNLSASFTTEVDTTSLYPTFTGPGSPTNQQPINVMVEFGEAVVGLSISDFVVTNATLTQLVDNGNGNFTAILDPVDDGIVTLALPADTVSDLAGNANRSSAPWSVLVDYTPPQPILTGPSPLTNQDPMLVAIDFGEPVNGFDMSDITVVGGVVTELVDQGNGQFTATIDVITDGPVSIDVAGNIATDDAGNSNLASVQWATLVDTTRPVPVITGPSDPVYIDTFDVLVDYGEPILGFDLTDLLIQNGNVTGVIDHANGTFTVSIQAIPTGEVEYDVTLSVVDSTSVDLAGNPNTASNELAVSMIVPTLSVVLTPSVMNENGGSVTAVVSRNTIPVGDMVVALTSSNVAEATVPASITIPDGQLSATFTVTAVDDLVQDGTRLVTITATTDGLDDGAAVVEVEDDETPRLQLSIDRGTINENGGRLTGRVVREAVMDTDLVVQLATDDLTEANVQDYVVIPAGSDYAVFSVYGNVDSLDDGDQSVDVAASAAFYYGSTQSFLVTDDGVSELIASHTGWGTTVIEGGAADTVTIQLRRAPASNVVVSVVSSDPAQLTVATSSVTFTSANWNVPQTISVTAPYDGLSDRPTPVDIVFSVNTTSSDPGFANAIPVTLHAKSVDPNVTSFTIASTPTSLMVLDMQTQEFLTEFPLVLGSTLSSSAQADELQLQLVPSNSPLLISSLEGDDKIVLSDLGQASVDAGIGTDTLELTSATWLDWQKLIEQVSNTEIVDVRSLVTKMTGELDAAKIEAIAGHAKRLTVRVNNLLESEIGQGWASLGTTLVDGVATHLAQQDGAVLEWINNHAWQNPFSHGDVNGSGDVSSIDALVVLNWLGRQGNAPLSGETPDDQATRYVDVDGSGDVTPLDALLVLNQVAHNRALRAESELFAIGSSVSNVSSSVSTSSNSNGVSQAELVDEMFAQLDAVPSAEQTQTRPPADPDWLGALQAEQLLAGSVPSTGDDDDSDDDPSPFNYDWLVSDDQ